MASDPHRISSRPAAVVSSDVLQAIERLAESVLYFGQSISDAINEKADELAMRHFNRCVPNRRLKETQYGEFLTQVLGHPPSEELLKRLVQSERGPRLADDELVALEERQNGRCALCGVHLNRSANPQVDHVIPLALFGTNELTNLQLLCQKCNVGKSSLVGWVMGAPFFRERPVLSARVRFCTLSSRRGRCLFLGCDRSSRDSEIEVIPIVPIANGGRWVFDNLTTHCIDHATEREASLRRAAQLRVRAGRYRAMSK
jgi:hypothetical protein